MYDCNGCGEQAQNTKQMHQACPSSPLELAENLYVVEPKFNFNKQR